jgi:hypothetical protein
MKSYFAKLAARATLANFGTPSTQAAANVPDPFENTAAATYPTARDDSTRHAKPATESQTERLGPSVQKEIVTHVVQETPAQLQHPPTNETLRLTPPEARHDADRQPDSKSESMADRSRSREPANDRDLSEPPIPKLIPAVEKIFTPADRRDADASRKAGEDQPSTPDESLNEMREEQTLLLRKADAFMETLFARHEPPPPGIQPDDGEEETRLLPRNREPESSPRLQPSPAPARLTESTEERAGLVIGELTVEITPPAPAPQPPAPVIVVQGGRSYRGGGLTSRRFGLGQF